MLKREISEINMELESYLGKKNVSGVYQAIINLIPPHETFIDCFLGTGAILKRKAPALRDIGIDLYKPCIDGFNYTAAEHQRHHKNTFDYNPDHFELYNLDTFKFLPKFDFQNSGRTVCYLDPPYVNSTRTGDKKYPCDFTDDDHIKLLNMALNLPCYIILSGYRNPIYEKYIDHWWSYDIQAMTRGGVRTETIWCNFTPKDIHYHTYAGKDFTDRQRIERKATGWAKKLEKLPYGERQAIIAALLAVD